MPDSSLTTLTSKITVCPRALVMCIGSRRWETMLATYEKMGWGGRSLLGATGGTNRKLLTSVFN